MIYINWLKIQVHTWEKIKTKCDGKVMTLMLFGREEWKLKISNNEYLRDYFSVWVVNFKKRTAAFRETVNVLLDVSLIHIFVTTMAKVDYFHSNFKFGWMVKDLLKITKSKEIESAANNSRVFYYDDFKKTIDKNEFLQNNFCTWHFTFLKFLYRQHFSKVWFSLEASSFYYFFSIPNVNRWPVYFLLQIFKNL